MIEFKKKTEIVTQKLYEILLKEFKSRTIKEEIYCVNIVYGSEEIFPPLYAYGLVSDKEKWIKKGKELKCYLWNLAEYTYKPYGEFSPEIDKETQNLFDEYNILTDKLETWKIAKRAIVDVAIKLKNHIDEFDYNKSNDFVIVVTDLEQVEVMDNFKLVNPELLNDFEDILI